MSAAQPPWTSGNVMRVAERASIHPSLCMLVIKMISISVACER